MPVSDREADQQDDRREVGIDRQQLTVEPTRPSPASTAVIPISSGRPAATSVPKVIVRMISVSGSESCPAFWRSSPMTWLTALLALASPNSLMSTAGHFASAAATAGRLASTRTLA